MRRRGPDGWPGPALRLPGGGGGNSQRERPLPESRTGPFPPPLASACPPAPAPAPAAQTRPARLTALEDGAVVRQAAAALERRAVPALVAQLVLTLVDRDVQALKRGCRHVGAAQAEAQLPLAQARQRQAYSVGGQRRLAGQLQAQNLIAEGPGNAEGVSGSAIQASRPLRLLPSWVGAFSLGLSLVGWVTGGTAHRLHNARNRRPAKPEGGGRGRGSSSMSKPGPEGPGGRIDQGLRDRETWGLRNRVGWPGQPRIPNSPVPPQWPFSSLPKQNNKNHPCPGILEEESGRCIWGLCKSPWSWTQPDTMPGTQTHSRANSDILTHKHHSTILPPLPLRGPHDWLPLPNRALLSGQGGGIGGRDWKGVLHHLHTAGCGGGSPSGAFEGRQPP